MKDLIKQILREHVANRVTIEEIILPEGFFTEILSEGTATIKVPSQLNSELNRKADSYYNIKDEEGNKWICPDELIQPNNNGQLECEMKFHLDVSKHWKQRILRDLEPDYMMINPKTKKPGKHSNKNIVRPHPFEGIDLLMNNINLIVKYINIGKKNWPINKEKSLLLKKGDYSEIIVVEREDELIYKLVFVTQIKGEPFFDTPQLKGSQNVKNLI
jgi:hypothetical protein